MQSQVLKWAGGEHEFALSVKDLLALQDRCGGVDGVGLIFQRLQQGSWRVQDVVSTLALGLEGDKFSRIEAQQLVEETALSKGLAELSVIALAVLANALYGYPEEPGESEVETS
ncbi:MAG: GTA-gp10 family protein [Pseudomonadota bacterium]